MTSTWVLLLTGDSLIAHTCGRLCDEAGFRLVVADADPEFRSVPAPGDPAPVVALSGAPPWPGAPALVLIGSDQPPGRALPAVAAHAPRIFVVSEPTVPAWRAALDLRVEQVVLLPEGETALRSRLGRFALHGAEGLVVAVTAGCGGGGASVLAATLARTASAFAPTLLVDLDPFGGGIDLLLGAEREPGARWPDLASVRGELLPGGLAGVLPVIDRMHVLSWDRDPGGVTRLPVEAVESVLGSARREYGVVVVDLPRVPDAAARAAAQLSDVALVTMPAEIRAAAAARRVLSALQELCADVRLVMRDVGRSGQPPAELAAALGRPLLEVLRPEPGLRDNLNHGEPPGLRRRGPLATFSREFLAMELTHLRWERERAS
jgi:secretion/DNA translocation related CpaE-like protein